MRKSKFIDIKVVFAAFIAMMLVVFTCLVPVSANTRDGVVSDEGIPNGDMSDGVISDTPDDDMMMGTDDKVDSGMNDGPTDSGNSVIGEAGDTIGQAGKDIVNGVGDAANDIANGMDDMTDVTNNTNGTDTPSDSDTGNLVGTVVWIVIAAAVIAVIVYFVCRKTPDKK